VPASPPAVIFDANVLFPATLRDCLLNLCEAMLVTGYWSARILEETFESIAASRPDLTAEQLAGNRAAMERFFEGARIEGYERRMVDLRLPDPGDLHVLAAAIEGEVDYIVTRNTEDFPERTLAEHGLERRSPDELVCELIDAHGPEVVCAVFAKQAAEKKRPAMTLADLLDRLARPSQGLPVAVGRLRGSMGVV